MRESSIPWSRWLAKKSARKAVSLGAWASGSLLVRRALADVPRLRVLCYHRIGDVPRDPFCVPRRDFRAQMRWLAETGRAVSRT